MRILPNAALLAAGVLVGAALPTLSGPGRDLLKAAGLPAHLLDWTGPAPTGALTPAANTGAPEPAGHDHAGHDHAGHDHGGQDHARHGHGEDEAEEGHVRMSADQIRDQDITLAKAEGGILSRHILVAGTVTPDTDRVARVPARVVGTVSEMRKRLGDEVAKGDVVAVLDSREVADAKSEYLTALVQAELQRMNFERQEKLLASRAVSEAGWQNARAAFQENQLRLDLARQKLSALGLNAAEVAAAQKRDEATPNASTLRQYELRAPIAGRIVERKVDVGTAVGKEGDPADLYTVADLSSVWIELAVPTAQLPDVRENAPVSVRPSQSIGQGGGKIGRGRVVFVSPFLNAETRSARVVVSLPNEGMAWRPGTYVTAELDIAQDPVPVRLPKAALQTVEGKRVVFVRNDEGFEAREVVLGRADDDAHEVVSGLAPGEEFALANSFLLKAELGKSEAGHAH
jgi:cobalt-zinc-cadmium efflux system membrane fusion protein